MLYLNLKSVLEARQIEKPYSFLVKIGIAPHTASKILANDTHVMRLDNLNHMQSTLLSTQRPLNIQTRPEIASRKNASINPINSIC